MVRTFAGSAWLWCRMARSPLARGSSPTCVTRFGMIASTSFRWPTSTKLRTLMQCSHGHLHPRVGHRAGLHQEPLVLVRVARGYAEMVKERRVKGVRTCVPPPPPHLTHSRTPSPLLDFRCATCTRARTWATAPFEVVDPQHRRWWRWHWRVRGSC